MPASKKGDPFDAQKNSGPVGCTMLTTPKKIVNLGGDSADSSAILTEFANNSGPTVDTRNCNPTPATE